MVSFKHIILLALSGPALADVTYGCWTDRSDNFHEDCLVAYTALISSWSNVLDDWVWIPDYVDYLTYGGCTASIKATGDWRRLPMITLIDLGNELISRCQNGFFYLNGGWVDVNVQGHAVAKRSPVASSGEVDTHWGHEYWTSSEKWTAELPSDVEEEIAMRKTAFQFNRKRAEPHGTFIAQENVPAIGPLRLFRATTSIHTLGQLSINAFQVYSNIVGMTQNVVNDQGDQLQRTGASIFTGDAEAVVMVLQLGSTFNSWAALFESDQAMQAAINILCGTALGNWFDGRWFSSVYHLYNSDNDVVLTFVYNAVVGTTSAFPT